MDIPTREQLDLANAVKVNGFDGRLLLALHKETMETWLWSTHFDRALTGRRELKKTDNFKTATAAPNSSRRVEVDHNLVLADPDYDPTKPKQKVVVPDNIRRLRDFSDYAFTPEGVCYQTEPHGGGLGRSVPRVVEEVKSGIRPLPNRRKLLRLRSNLCEYYYVDPQLVTDFLFEEDSKYVGRLFHRDNYKPVHGRRLKHNPDLYLFREGE